MKGNNFITKRPKLYICVTELLKLTVALTNTPVNSLD
jgi:hypothetical protein